MSKKRKSNHDVWGDRVESLKQKFGDLKDLFFSDDIFKYAVIVMAVTFIHTAHEIYLMRQYDEKQKTLTEDEYKQGVAVPSSAKFKRLRKLKPKYKIYKFEKKVEKEAPADQPPDKFIKGEEMKEEVEKKEAEQ